ncbi:nuclear transport factor 2 family protein [Piscinibacter terrae]|uniref:Nuclear transport factor 2 family protein n=1 Tax=Piscinibacter terrae TaxID=2496871 RepID=A0A3N7HIS9_9BURK|nr:nuclear transport factor 2 family protein [Albitalea terrae]RQP21944.1 nuclear transport factor 2 family protein [Albitalea terrae]
MDAPTASPSPRLADSRQTWETYTAAWKPENLARRRGLFELTLSRDCEYRDPLVHAIGWDALDNYMQDFQRQVPGGHFVTTWFVAHHDRSVAKWEMRGADGSVLGHGVSYAEYADDGKLRAMNGFFDTP